MFKPRELDATAAIAGLEKFASELGMFCDTNGSNFEVILRWDGTASLMADTEGADTSFEQAEVFATVADLWEHIAGGDR
jgi:hypothetical protein